MVTYYLLSIVRKKIVMAIKNGDNAPFVTTIRELPQRVAELGYTPINPQIINSRTGIYMTLIALFRIPEMTTNLSIFDYVTTKIGKDLSIDPYELITPNDYRNAAGPRKLEYRTNADSRAYTLINQLINSCKDVSREIKSLKRQDDLIVKIERVISTATNTFKRIVSIKELSFGGAYLLDEDVYEKIEEFEKGYLQYKIVPSSTVEYSDVIKQECEIVKLLKNMKKLEMIKSDEFNKIFFKAHGCVETLFDKINRQMKDMIREVSPINESITFSKDFIKRMGNDHTSFDATIFKQIPVNLEVVKGQFQSDIDSFGEVVNKVHARYLDTIPDGIRNKGNVNPSYLVSSAKKYGQALTELCEELQSYTDFSYHSQFGNTSMSIKMFYDFLQKGYSDNISFRDSVDKSFKVKRRMFKKK